MYHMVLVWYLKSLIKALITDEASLSLKKDDGGIRDRESPDSFNMFNWFRVTLINPDCNYERIIHYRAQMMHSY